MNDFWKDILSGGLPRALDWPIPAGTTPYMPTDYRPVAYPIEQTPPSAGSANAITPAPVHTGSALDFSNPVVIGGAALLVGLVVFAVVKS